MHRSESQTRTPPPAHRPPTRALPRSRKKNLLTVLLACAAMIGAENATAGEPVGAKDTLQLENLRVKARKRPSFPRSGFQEMRNRSASVLKFRKKVRLKDPNVAANFVGEAMVPGAQVWMYPDGAGYPRPSMSDKQARDGRFSLELVLKADAYSGGAVCSPSPIDLSKNLETGMLELWVKGAEGKEVFSIGLLDNGNNGAGRPLQVSVSSRSHAKVLGDQWKKIQVPIRAFGIRGSFWSEEMNARVFNTFNWTSVSCLSFDIDKDRHKSFRVYLDDAVIYKKAPGGMAAGGSGYAFSNEDFQDFPTAGR